MLTTVAAPEGDPYQWLEDVAGPKSLEYVEAQNAITVKQFESKPDFAPIQKQLRDILDSQDRIPYVQQLGDHLYNFWQDKQNPRGLFRRTTWDEYRKPQPQWETVLDVDQLSKDEKENWVWHGSSTLPPDYRRCLISLSRGGGDAHVTREFDLQTRQFVKDGFSLPEAKSQVVWRNLDQLYVGTDFGEGSLTDSGYPRLVKLWRRGTPLAEAQQVYQGQKTDVSVSAWVEHTPGFFREGFSREIAFYKSETFLIQPEKAAENSSTSASVDPTKYVKFDVPDDAQVNMFRQWLTVRLRSDWKVGGKTFPAGALLVTELAAFLQGARTFEMLFEPQPRLSLLGVSETKNALVLNVSDNVRGRVIELQPGESGWRRREMHLPGQGTVTAAAVDAETSDDLWVSYQDFLIPPSLYLTSLGKDPAQPLKTLPAFFDAAGMTVQQFEATSADKTQVPYFVVGKQDAIASGKAPTLQYGYGGFEIPQFPRYSAGIGTAWLQRGGIYVLANIRGGGEFGPAWHQAALKANRQHAFDDFEAIAADLVKRGITGQQHLGIMGGSNGGLLVSTVAIQRPELFKAVVCQVPLTDMKRFHKLLAGASWMAEYGNPDQPADWEYLAKYSPYQNAKAGVTYPRILFTTSTRDDRVHPAHARKLYAKLKDFGQDVFYFENTEGGHAGSTNNEQRARIIALEYTFLLDSLR